MLAQSLVAPRPGARERVAAALAHIPSGARRRLVLLHDVLAAYASFLLAVLLRDDVPGLQPGLATAHLLMPLFLLLFTVTARRYRMDQGVWRFVSQADLLTIAKVAAISIAAFYLGLFVVQRLADVPRSLPLIQWLVLVFLLAGTRTAYAAWLIPARGGGRAAVRVADWEPVLLVGAGQGAALLIDLLRPGGPTGSRLEVVGILDNRGHYHGRAIGGVPVVGQVADVEQVVARLAIHGMRPRRLVLALSPEELGPERVQAVYEAAARQQILVQEPIELLHPPSGASERENRGEALAGQPPVQGWSWSLKRLVDIAASANLLLAAAPTMLLTATAIRLTLGSPVIFHQVRPGRHLHAFTLYKFRTLKDGHLPDGGILADEDRLTALGRFLRRTRIDELPQLWNVLIGDMSLVGPRPLLPRDLPELGGGAAHERFLVRPGITGWAQINGGHSLTMDEKLVFDMWYIENHSLTLDLVITIRTLYTILVGDQVNKTMLKRVNTSKAVELN